MLSSPSCVCVSIMNDAVTAILARVCAFRHSHQWHFFLSALIVVFFNLHLRISPPFRECPCSRFIHNQNDRSLGLLQIVNKSPSFYQVSTGGGDSSVVRAPDSWLKGRGFESLLERRENFLLQGRLSVLTLISVSIPPPCYHSST